jgi:murein DD-endopeptidase MepM/ murein hydrolase activator NlpD
MTSRRRSPLPAIRAVRGALAVLGVAAFVSVLIVTGRQAAASRPFALVADAAIARPALLAPTAPADVALPHGPAASYDRATRTTTARASRSHPRVALHRWVRPNSGPLTSPFGYRWGRLHAGIDLAGPYGSTIVAATDGCITYAGPQQGYGTLIIIRDWDGTETYYGHMSAYLRRSGCVTAGTPIARVGEAGDATGPHVHFEVRVGGSPVDPIPFLARRGLDI